MLSTAFTHIPNLWCPGRSTSILCDSIRYIPTISSLDWGADMLYCRRCCHFITVSSGSRPTLMSSHRACWLRVYDNVLQVNRPRPLLPSIIGRLKLSSLFTETWILSKKIPHWSAIVSSHSCLMEICVCPVSSILFMLMRSIAGQITTGHFMAPMNNV